MDRPVIIKSEWDHNGSWRVEVAGPWPRTDAGERAARRKARSVDTMGKVQWSRLNGVQLDNSAPGTLRLIYSFTVSRLPREHR